MQEFVVYHHPGRMPYDVTQVQTFEAFTDKDVTAVPGARVWVVGRRGKGRYYLGLVFRAARRIRGKAGFRHGVAGAQGYLFFDKAEIGAERWFTLLKREMGNFRFGLTAIDAPSIRAGLLASARRAGCTRAP